MFQPKKVNESDLKTSRREQEHVKDMFSSILPKPVFGIKHPDSPDKKSSQKSAKKTSENLF
jgi:hypothetical protein